MIQIESPVIKTCRELLGVASQATADELKKAYRHLAQVYHPDKNDTPWSAAVFLRIKEAYQILSDPQEIERLNAKYLNQQCLQVCVEGLNLNFGSFFGHRFFTQANTPYVTPDRQIGTGGVEYTFEDAYQGEDAYPALEGSRSILDDPSFDFAEVVFAGEMSDGDEHCLAQAFREKDFSVLPWYVINNEGIVHFLERHYADALDRYDVLVRRIGNNIVFLYRLGICHAIVAFQHKTQSLIRGEVPDPDHINRAIRCFTQAIRLGEERRYTPQKCLSIRKTLADLYEKLDRTRHARRLWSQILEMEPRSREARYKLNQMRSSLAGLLPAWTR
jgi:tetratricopeptide (TPR) repeat protein